MASNLKRHDLIPPHISERYSLPPDNPSLSEAASYELLSKNTDSNISYDLYIKTALRGDSEKQFSMGQIYYTGVLEPHIQKDSVEAFKWFRLSALKGYNPAYNVLGFLYANGVGVKQDYTQALHSWKPVLYRGNPYAWACVGLLYSKGHGVKKDYRKALQHWVLACDSRWAARRISSYAMTQIGLLHLNGSLGEKAYDKAKMYFTEAARRENAGACIILGSMYARGYGVEKDTKEAKKHWKTAINLADLSAQERQNLLNKISEFDKTPENELDHTEQERQVPMPKDGKPDTQPDLNARGEPRKNRPMRTREEVGGGDPHAEANRPTVKMGGRVPRELRDAFAACIKAREAQGEIINQSTALEEAVQAYLDTHCTNG